MITLVLGGTRSGKSAVAEGLALDVAGSGAVTYVAPAVVDGADADHAARVEVHRRRRASEEGRWRTVESTDVVGVLAAETGTVLVDSLGSWVAAHPDLVVDELALVGALAARTAPTVVVSEEVGLGVHPISASGRAFVDVLGTVNAAVAGVAARVVMVVAGRTLELGGR